MCTNLCFGTIDHIVFFFFLIGINLSIFYYPMYTQPEILRFSTMKKLLKWKVITKIHAEMLTEKWLKTRYYIFAVQSAAQDVTESSKINEIG